LVGFNEGRANVAIFMLRNSKTVVLTARVNLLYQARRPLVGPSKIDGVYLNTGHEMLGWTLACATGHDMAAQAGTQPGAGAMLQ